MSTQIKALTGFNFQNFIKELFFYKYGSADFKPLRPVKDLGNDGVITIEGEKLIIACYGYQTYDKTDSSKKIQEDYQKYMEHWSKDYPKWIFIVNQPLAPEQIKDIAKLKDGSDVDIYGLDQLLHIIFEEISKAKLRKLAKYLRVDETYISNDYFGEILEGLLNDSLLNSQETIKYKPSTFITDKIELNYTGDDIDIAKREFELVSESLMEIQNLIANYEDNEIKAIKLKIINDYQRTTGTFKARINQLTDIYQSKYASEKDDDSLLYIRAILLYHFEQCLIGKRTKEE